MTADARSLLALARRAKVLTFCINATLALAIAMAFFVADSVGGVHSILLIGALGMWFAATAVAVRSRQQIQASQQLIEQGDLDGAQAKLRQVIRGVYVPAVHRRIVLANSAQVYQLQHRWKDVAALGDALSRASSANDAQPPLLLLLQALVELRDIHRAHAVLHRAEAMPRSLQTSLYLMLVRLDLELAMNADAAAASNFWKKMELAELLPAKPAAMSHAFLALAAQRRGQHVEAAWCKRRSELLSDPATLLRQRPILAELWLELRT